MRMNTLPFSLGSHTPTKFTTSTKLSSLITNHPNTTSEQASSTVKFSTNQHNDNPIVLIKRREAIGGIGLCCGFLLDVLSQSQLASAADGASLCELTVAPSGLAYCDKMVGTGPEAVKGQLIKVIKGWDAGILGGDGVPPMLAGGKRTLKLPPELGYGMRGAGCKGGSCIIPPNSVLFFDVEFIGKA
ncbi:hypothetical protein ACSBR1_014202 [Camellia fascicularis]